MHVALSVWRLSHMREKAETQDEKEDLLTRLSEHRRHIFADRAADARLSSLAEVCNIPGSEMPARVLKIDLDGMDQSKFRCPRNTASTKAHEHLWRPELHLTGVVIYGVCEIYFSADCDIRKGSNTQQTILARSVDIAAEILAERGLSLPAHIVFHVAVRSDCRYWLPLDHTFVTHIAH